VATRRKQPEGSDPKSRRDAASKRKRTEAAAGTDTLSGARADRAALDAPRWSFDGVVQRMLGFSRAAELEGESLEERGARSASKRVVAAPSEPSPQLDALKLFVRSLDDDTRGKLRAVMRAGREAAALPDVIAALATEPAPEADLFAEGAVGLQHLQRGHALARATAFDLERQLSRWSKVAKDPSLDERVWLRFGRELARSRADEWTCFALVGADEHIEKLFLRCGKQPWWSFGALIDRPSERKLGVLRSTRSGRSRILVLPLASALGRPSRGELKAVRRASSALSARLGLSRMPERAGAASVASGP